VTVSNLDILSQGQADLGNLNHSPLPLSLNCYRVRA
jgi:hypothetical protein